MTYLCTWAWRGASSHRSVPANHAPPASDAGAHVPSEPHRYLLQQILFPFLVGIVFAIWKRDAITCGICWAWSTNAMCDGARYIYDAPRGKIMLLGGSDGLGDWSKILGPEHFDKLYLADRLAAEVRTVGIITWILAVALVMYALVHNLQGNRRSAAAAAPRVTAKPSTALAPVAEVDMWRH